MFPCAMCGKKFTRRDNMVRHIKTTRCDNIVPVSSSSSIYVDPEETDLLCICETCGEYFQNVQDRVAHEKQCTNMNAYGLDNININDESDPAASTSTSASEHYNANSQEMALLMICGKCGIPHESIEMRVQHEQNNCLKRKAEGNYSRDSKIFRMKQVADENGFVEFESAFKGALKTYYLKNYLSLNENASNKDIIVEFLNSNFDKVLNKIKEAKLTSNDTFKINFILECEYVSPNPVLSNEIQNRSFKTKNMTVTSASNLNCLLLESMDKLKKESEECQIKGSGWTLKAVNGLLIRINKYLPLRGNEYVELPSAIKNKKAVINVQNFDEYCFKYAVLAKLVTSKPHRVSSYANLNHPYDFSGINFPASFHDIEIFEKKNNISINLFGIDEENQSVFPVKILDVEKPDHRDLLYIKSGDKSHFCYISNFNRLVSNQYSKRGHGLFICKRCFKHFEYGRYDNANKFEDHKRLCAQNKPCRIELPKKNSILSFVHFERQFRLPCVIYADFESVLRRIQNCENRKDTSFTNTVQLHEPVSFGVYVKFDDSIPIEFLTNIPSEPIIYRGSEAPKKFMETLIQIVDDLGPILTKNKDQVLDYTDEQRREFEQSDQCYICGGGFHESVSDIKKVLDHCHITGKYRGAAHNKCNLKLRTQNFIPVYLHNLSKYDGHFIVRMLGIDNKRIEVIASTEEIYISFSKHCNHGIKLRFVDSYRLMPSSLDSLSKNLRPENFRETKKIYSDPRKFELLIKKGVFCYDYLDSAEKFGETRLPPKSHFHNSLKNSQITDEEYDHAQNVWTTFSIQNLGEYMDLYLKSDVLLLSDIFENFRDMCMQTYNLDAAYYFTAPSIAFDAALKLTNVKLELLSDSEMYAMIESSIRGGICQAVGKHAIANNKYMKTHNPESEQVFIKYFDVTNLYGWAMCQPLPYGGFEWVEDPQSIDIGSIKDDADIGYFFDVTIDYPEVLHDCHADFPLLPVRQKPPGGKVKKLLTTLEDKDRYVLHGKNLKQALSLGLKLKTIHRALKFKQSNWLKKYVDLNTSKRNASTNEFDKANFKLMVNAFFGKSMENVRKRMCLELVNDKKRLLKLIASPKFKDRTIYSENLCAIHMNKTKIELNKPMYIGMAILDLSKTLMYDFHYNIIKPVFANRIRLLYMDTDSFIYRISSPDVYIELLPLQNHFDCSDYAIDHPFFSMDRKKIIGTMKDETAGVEITEFVGIRAKMYSFTTEDEKEVKKIKGVTKTAVSNSLSFKDFRDTVQLEKNYYVKMRIFRSIKHIIYTQDLNKLALSWHDDKRVLMPDKVSTLPHGHYSLRLLFDEDYH